MAWHQSVILLCAATLFVQSSVVAQSGSPKKDARDGVALDEPVESDLQVAVTASVRALALLEEEEDAEKASALVDELNQLTEQVRQADPQTPWLHYLYGRLYAATGRDGDAVSRLRKFVETREGRNEWHAYRLLGDLFINDFPRLAKSNYEKATSLKGDEPAVLLGLSRCASKLGRKKKAVTLATEAVDADGGRSIRYVSHLSHVLALAQEWIGAQQVAERAVTLAEKDAEASPGKRGPLLLLDAQIKQLIEVLYLRLADSTDEKELQDGYLLLAEHAQRRADNGTMLSRFDVLDVLEVGVERTSPNTPAQLLEQYAVTLAQVGRTDEARKQFEQLQKAAPQNAAAADWLSRAGSTPPKDQ